MNGKIEFTYLSQGDLLKADCLDMKLGIAAAERGLKDFHEGRILFPEKIVQIFNEETQDRINCLPATLLDENVCGMKWVSVFPRNPVLHKSQNLSAVIVLSELERGFPIAVMDGTLCSNVRVAAMGALAARHLANLDSEIIGFIGTGEQAKMHLLGMKSVIPSLKECRVASKTVQEEEDFIKDMSAVVPDMKFVSTECDLEKAMCESDILVTATSAQAPLLKADWVKPGAFYSHVGGWEDEFQVAKICDKIVCDDWETVKHRTQTLSRMYKSGELSDSDIYANLTEIVVGEKSGREKKSERVYFNAVGLSYVDISIAHAMFKRGLENNAGTKLPLQENMIFNHDGIEKMVKL